MKTSSVGAFVSSLLLVAISASAQSPSASTSWQVSEKGPHHRVWERTEYETAPDGRQMPRVHRYTELATGLNFKNASGEWEESKEEIQLLPNGAGASAGKGQHKAIFPANILDGRIELNTPEGQWLRSQILGLAYFDSSSGKSVLIAELKSSAGEIHSPNVVLYPDAFTDIKADVRYTYTRAGFEQDIVLREQPPSPADYGLSPESAKIEVLTEFFNPPQPVVESMNLKTLEGVTLADQTLGFGGMSIGRGKAFSQDNPSKEIPVAKQWQKLEGRDFLIEEVRMPDLKEQLQLLPAPEGASLKVRPGKQRRTASIKRELPIRKLVKVEKREMKLAQAPIPATGLVLDYITLNGNLSSGFVFKGDTTYYISGASYMSYGTVFEGGTVIKYAVGAYISIQSSPPDFRFKASAYLPIIFTAKDDNTVGATIAGSTGNPTGYYANPVLSFGGSSYTFPTLKGPFRISYASVGINSGGFTESYYDAQFFKCGTAFSLGGVPLYVGNALFSDVDTVLNAGGGVTASFQNITVNRARVLVNSSGTYSGNSMTVYNGVFANVTNWNIGYLSPSAVYSGFYKTTKAAGTGNITNTFDPFQTAGAGNYYLAQNCSFKDAGGTSIDATLLSGLRKKTTAAPLSYANFTIAAATNFVRQMALDLDTPDMGYHYDPVDYVVNSLTVSNATLTIGPGVVIAASGQPGIVLKNGATVNSTGTPLTPNWFTYCASAQDGSTSWLGTNGVLSSVISLTGSSSTGSFRFSKFSSPADAGYQTYQSGASIYGSLTLQDCEFWGGMNDFSGSSASASTATLKNNLFWRSSLFASNTTSLATLSLSNNLFWNTTVTLSQPSSVVWKAFDNSFDGCVVTNSSATAGYNAYLASSGRIFPTNSGDYVSAGIGSYVTSTFGDFYQNSTVLVNKGSVTADLNGLYQYTTRSTQSKETNSIVDIGYHYVAADSRGYPQDLDGDGIPDYLEDANGNGVVDAGETSWFVNNYNGLISGAGLQVFTPLK